MTAAGSGVEAAVRRMLAEVTGDSLALAAPADTPLLRDGLGLDSLGATVLLSRVQAEFRVDVAAEDLNLDALASVGALATFVAQRVTR